MAFIKTVPENEAEGTVQEMYQDARARGGYIPNYTRLFSNRPEVYAAWKALLGSIRKKMRLRRYELVTLAASRKLGCTYCMLAHGSSLLENTDIDEDQLIAIAKDYHNAGLEPVEVAMMAFAEKVIESAHTTKQADIDHLRSFGLTDEEVMDITLAVTARSFFSKTLDALNAEPDATYTKLSPALIEALSVGRAYTAVPGSS
jgi:uncharacterized peroxidase-related enzyme